MKKTIALLLTALLLCAALPVFAKAPPAVATEDGRITVEPSARVTAEVPSMDCSHSGGEREIRVTEQLACGEYRSYDQVCCAECGLFLKTRNLTSGTNHAHIGDWIKNGPFYELGVGYYYTYTCASCGADMGWLHAGF